MWFLLFQTDLVHTVGESAALGASGVIMWGGTKEYKNKVTATLDVHWLESEQIICQI